ncbi:barstar family protein [Massilia sp. DWR3-1-1]|uniref:barstar family protein n=1 Tax=Massilia sp. DWR3-1-1 TaxID=2804559 RepID=UPI003CF393B0
MATVELKGAAIDSAAAFHLASQAAFGFPDSYSHTIDGWVDCLSYLRDADGMSKFRLFPKEMLEIVITDSAALQARLPELVEEISYCVAGINERYADYGELPALKLVLR